MSRASRHEPTLSRPCLARRFLRSARGSNSVEFAILAPILCLLLLGAVYVGLYIGRAHSLAQIAADVSRYAMVGETSDQRRDMAVRWLDTSGRDYPLIDPRQLHVEISEASDMMRVSVSYDMSDLPLPELVRQSVPLPQSVVRTASVLIP